MIYRKHGVVTRWENGTLVHVTESGMAIDGEPFQCMPLSPHPAGRGEDQDYPSPRESGEKVREARMRGASALAAIAAGIESMTRGLTIERLILTEGSADHEYGEKRWSEEMRRIHLSLVKHQTRALIDLAAFDLEEITPIVDALHRLDQERDPPPRLRLAPNVTAALIPSLIGVAPPNVELIQTAGGVDGKGQDIDEARGDWPNWYRPSYRLAPLRMPLDVRIECGVTEIEEDRPRAIALLAPVDGLQMRLLVDDGRRAYPTTVRITRIDAVAKERRWYPYGGGSFGAEMML